MWVLMVPANRTATALLSQQKGSGADSTARMEQEVLLWTLFSWIGSLAGFMRVSRSVPVDIFPQSF